MAISVKGDSLIKNNDIYSTNIGIKLVEDGDIVIDNNSISVEANQESMNNSGIVIQKPIDKLTAINNIVITNGEYAVIVGDTEGSVNNNYLVSEKFLGDDSVYIDGAATAYDNAPLLVSDLYKSYKDGQTLNVTALDEYGSPMDNVTLIATIKSVQYEATTDDTGLAQFDINNLTPGNYIASIRFKNGNGANATAKVTVTKSDTVISAPDVNMAYKDPSGEVVATIVNEHGKPLVVNLNIEFNGKTYNVRTDSNGQASIPVGNLTPGKYSATISYKGSSNYRASNATALVTVTKSDTVISAPDVKVAYKDPNGEVVATITNEHGKPLVVNLNIEFNGETYNVRTDSNGQASIPIGNVTPGTYTATISYKGSSNYRASTATAKVTVTKSDTVMSASDVNIAYKDPNGELVATITNEHGKPLVVNLNVELNGKNYTVRTDSNGQATLSIATLTPGTYTATISYKGSSNYRASTATAKVTVTKSDTVISAPDVNIAYKDPNGELVATIVNEHGKPLVVTLNIELNGKTYNVRTDSNGQARLSLDTLTPGNYTATISYKGSGNYEASTATAQVVVVKSDTVLSAPDVEVAYKDPNGKLVSTITNEHGKPLVVSLNVKLNGKTYTVRTDSNGQMNVSTANLDPGTYTATISYKGSKNYNPTNTTANITVKP
jgi:antitoxin component YwqK of YwqJK toxin-antitoxin module